MRAQSRKKSAPSAENRQLSIGIAISEAPPTAPPRKLPASAVLSRMPLHFASTFVFSSLKTRSITKSTVFCVCTVIICVVSPCTLSATALTMPSATAA